MFHFFLSTFLVYIQTKDEYIGILEELKNHKAGFIDVFGNIENMDLEIVNEDVDKKFAIMSFG
ncbi:hypothetical protein AZF37_02900 [endosymbiont 'TC1' of Trimyema compressum]|uniref:hypothetical protein n=1 Tax=endosymbiont 'TC1' of Trimyema compressum TaxID=243899 RepID=UPI0007F0B8B7|nr:hypothetical protein [endosymbiont 'TC1' of Trimyema compressum]AMP20260.1 hypothetical protein AZF37_02900 [endosymbiont 'TC1' of Trimyema compressum]